MLDPEDARASATLFRVIHNIAMQLAKYKFAREPSGFARSLAWGLFVVYVRKENRAWVRGGLGRVGPNPYTIAARIETKRSRTDRNAGNYKHTAGKAKYRVADGAPLSDFSTFFFRISTILIKKRLVNIDIFFLCFL